MDVKKKTINFHLFFFSLCHEKGLIDVLSCYLIFIFDLIKKNVGNDKIILKATSVVIVDRQQRKSTYIDVKI